jgi:hypothetical protein
VQLLPGFASIPGSVNGASVTLDKDNFIGVTAPHDILQWGVDLKYLELDFVCIECLHSSKNQR